MGTSCFSLATLTENLPLARPRVTEPQHTQPKFSAFSDELPRFQAFGQLHLTAYVSVVIQANSKA